MLPQTYQFALLAVVLSIPVNRVAITVVLAWAFGQAVHNIGPYEDAADMFAYMVACGAAFGLCRGEQWRNHANIVVAALFVPVSAIAAYAASVGYYPPLVYNTWATLLWLQIIAVLAGNDWTAVDRYVLRAVSRGRNLT